MEKVLWEKLRSELDLEEQYREMVMKGLGSAFLRG